MRAKRVLLAVIVTVVSYSADATQYLNNGSFETGDFTGWLLSNDLGGNATTVQPRGYNSFGMLNPLQNGDYFVYSGQADSAVVLSQTFADMAGTTLNISGWSIGDPTTPAPCLGCTTGSGIVTYLFNGMLLGTYTPGSRWTQQFFQATATGNDTFAVAIRNDPSFTGVDNFSVASGVAPLPSSWTMLVLGLAGFGFAACRGSRKRYAVIAGS